VATAYYGARWRWPAASNPPSEQSPSKNKFLFAAVSATWRFVFFRNAPLAYILGAGVRQRFIATWPPDVVSPRGTAALQASRDERAVALNGGFAGTPSTSRIERAL
jgi:hypothetical protein